MLTKTCNCERAAIFLWYCLLISWFSVHVRQACVIPLSLCPSAVDAIVFSGKAFHSTWIKRKKTLRFGSKYFILKMYGKPLINSKLHVGMERAFYSTWQQSSYRSLKPGKFWNFISLVWKVMDFDQVVMESHGKWLKMNFVKKQKQKQNKKFLEQSSVIGTVILFVFVGPCLVQRYVRICWACWQKIVKNFKFVNPQFCKDITQNHKICKFCKHVQS